MLQPTIGLSGHLTLKQQIGFYNLSQKDRRIFLRKAATEVMKHSRKRITKQTTLDGSKFAARSKKSRNRKKLLNKYKKGMFVHGDSNQFTVTWRNKLDARTASVHQYGITETKNAAMIDKVLKGFKQEIAEKSGDKATTAQAKRMIKLGYLAPLGKRGGNYKRPTIAWIKSHISKRQATMLLVHDLGHKRTPKKSWVIQTAKRDFLGWTNNEIDDFIDWYLARFNTAGSTRNLNSAAKKFKS